MKSEDIQTLTPATTVLPMGKIHYIRLRHVHLKIQSDEL